MNMLLRMYPGDAWAFLIANVLVQVTVVILAARLLARLGSRWNAAWRHSIYMVALVCVLASPVLSWVMQATGITLVTLRPSVAESLRQPKPATQFQWPTFRTSSLIETPAPPQITEKPACIRRRTVSRQALRTRQTRRAASLSRYSPGARRSGPGDLAVGNGSARRRVGAHGLRLIAALRRAAQPLDGAAMAELLSQVRRPWGPTNCRRWPRRPTWTGRSWSG